ncbi:MAG TPA: polysaccharide deacetylase family protein [Thiobacillus sp.]|nr:MAG: polysaccharide deacetylase [Hydrogenophilales bacterium 28-61-11]OYZ58939.1 MAG: polysaccharide deacetylase [Hydrogenophilales bacterium 16-61-112]OZA46950.1 MAG: polysaccharide deacetylase [Hydrogenophilales bacterium 17-61-76]HQT30368.1 polysaccharide deacetylase family protein [Thiobacillus sp.]HQT69020.1 polysaccharide deacetylase family protein [Thiobacillus sp.]
MTWIDPISRSLHRQAGQHGPIMLMYHAITPGKAISAWPWSVSMQRFRDQLDFLATEGYATPTMGELVAAPAKTWRGRTAVITFDDGYIDNLDACQELMKRGMRATWFIVSGSVGQSPLWPDDGRPAGRLLNVAELRDMQENGMEIGSHTVNHVRLPETDDVRLMQELTDSKATLEDILGNAVNSFAYPYGAWDVRCAEAVEQAGYAAACTTRTGWALRDKDPYRLRRLTVFNTDTLGSFTRKLYFGSHDVRWRDIAAYALRRLRRV